MNSDKKRLRPFSRRSLYIRSCYDRCLNVVAIRNYLSFLDDNNSIDYRMFFILSIFEMIPAGNFYIITYPNIFIDYSPAYETASANTHKRLFSILIFEIFVGGK